MPHAAYRAEIDGLRAIAVVPVMLFHLGTGWLPGGFVGVDVFFVISGYLITRILLAESAHGAVSLRRFYVRRLRRIAPNLLAMLVATTLAALVVLIPLDLLRFAQSVIAAIASASNVLFWLRTGYFEADAAQMPLLHTWSLGVEEQYYLVFPLLVAALARRPRALVAVLAASWLVSLLAAERLLDGAPAAAFYLLPGRWWELMTGSLVAALPQSNALAARPRAAALVALGGLGAIGVAMVSLGAQTRFPGVAALLPCAGTAVVIAGEGAVAGNGLAGRLLAFAPLRITGLASFALYLWHWPVIVLAHYVVQREFSARDTAVIVVVIGALGFGSWRGIERPLRQARLSLLVPLVAVVTAVLLGLGTLVIATRGLPQRYPPALRGIALGTERVNPARAACDSPGLDRIAGNAVCTIGAAGVAPRFALVGDSFADALVPGFDAAARRLGLAGRVYSFSGCAVLAGAGNSARCRRLADATFVRLAADRSIERIVLVERWTMLYSGQREGLLPRPPGWLDDDATRLRGPANNRRVLADGLGRTLALLGRDRVVVVHGMPEPLVYVPQFATLRASAGMAVPGLSRAHYAARQAGVATLLGRVVPRAGGALLDLGAAMCGPAECPVVAGGTALYSDDNHPSRDFAVMLAPALAPALSHGVAR